MAHHDLRTHPLVVRRVQVLRAQDVTSRMRRITVGGQQLRAFSASGFDLPAFTCPGFDDHIKLIFSASGDVEGALPVQRASSIDWPECDHRLGRDYTPRRWDERMGELDLDFVLHGDGPAAEWARSACPGDDLWFVGPKSSTLLPEDIDHFVLAGDETALPAIGRFLDERPDPAPAHIVVQIAHDSARQNLALGPTDTIEWVVSEDPRALDPAVRALSWSAGRTYIWIAGESTSLLPLRRWLKRDRQVPKTHTSITGYWTVQTNEARSRRADLTVLDPMPWLACRVAIDLGLLDRLEEESVPEAELAVDTADIAPLIDYLVHLDILAVAKASEGPRLLSLGPRGSLLQSDEHARETYFGPGHGGDILPVLSSLAGAIRASTSAWEVAHGVSRANAIAKDPELFDEQMHEAQNLEFVARGVITLDAWRAAQHIVVSGPGAITLARAAAEADDPSAISISARRAPADLIRTHAAGLCPVGEPAHADLVVSALEAEPRSDAEVGALLAELGELANRCLLVEESTPEVPGLAGRAGTDYAVREGLLTFAATGAAPRTAESLSQLAEAAGWVVCHIERLGWDYVVLDLSR
ncbi:MAG: siderophore-interacting protein [Brevibacterium aurantiacum]|uniref:siderophore-interacting protein n=1 Tax=Brevibacterium aurantiacum TaxID=273384 RepID=UPI003F8ED9EE